MLARTAACSHPPRGWRLPLVLAALLLVALGAAAPRTAAAQESNTPAIVGSWSVGFPNEELNSRHLASFLPGGVVLMTNAPVFAEPTVAGDQIYSTAGHGAWERRADGSYAFTVLFLYFDAEEENWGTLTVDGVVTLDATGEAFAGTFRAVVTDAAGGPLFTGEEEPLTGARIRPGAGDGGAPPMQ
jgi:hypothetical protein